ncbi:hypothetical protein ACFWFQ_08740 [Nocardia salmonicida]|uniref:hypothetical protein n=1 Tax=Nocardia salmonicida TaxID=53431 RepID=UPI00364984CF
MSCSCSLLHVPYALTSAPGFDERLRPFQSCGAEKVTEIRILATALTEGTEAMAAQPQAAREATTQPARPR